MGSAMGPSLLLWPTGRLEDWKCPNVLISASIFLGRPFDGAPPPKRLSHGKAVGVN